VYIDVKNDDDERKEYRKGAHFMALHISVEAFRGRNQDRSPLSNDVVNGKGTRRLFNPSILFTYFNVFNDNLMINPCRNVVPFMI